MKKENTTISNKTKSLFKILWSESQNKF